MPLGKMMSLMTGKMSFFQAHTFLFLADWLG